MIGNNMAKSKEAANIDFIEIDTLQKSHRYSGIDISDYQVTQANDSITKITIITMDGKVRTFGGSISVNIVNK